MSVIYFIYSMTEYSTDIMLIINDYIFQPI